MSDIDTKGMQVAELTNQQFIQLREMEQKLNNSNSTQDKIYLLAVTRH